MLTFSSFGPPFVIIRVGADDHQQTFAVHESLLIARSPEFKKQLADMAEEHNHKAVPIPEIDPQAFALYVQFLYTGHIPSKLSETTDTSEHTHLCRLYNLALSLQDVAAQNAACDAIYAKATEPVENMQDALPRRDHIEIIYSGTLEQCAAKRLMVDLYTAQANREWLQNAEDKFPPDFMSALAVNLMGIRFMAVLSKPKEHYHVVDRVEKMFEA
jgi:ACT domain-containing protein